MEFEVKKTDLLGRIGIISVKNKKIETPCLLPVVHPIRQEISIEKIRSAGFNAVMTNSYIIYKRMRQEAEKREIHSILGFDGVVMTDSGGYQVLEYGDVEVRHDEIADFQCKIGSDIAVTLDRPTGLTSSYREARKTVEISLENSVKTISKFQKHDIVWVGPIQGGLFKELVRMSASALVKSGFEFLALGSPTQVMENYMFRELLKMILNARSSIPYSIPLHLFGAGHPLTIAISVALGCDTFDSASYILFAKQGRYMTESIVHELKDLEYLPCSCEVCQKRTASELKEMSREERIIELGTHNLLTLKKEVERTKQAIKEGMLWDLVREKSSSHPSLKDAFRYLASVSERLISTTPAHKKRGLFVLEKEDMKRPELLIARKRLGECVRKRKSKCVIIMEKGLENLEHLFNEFDLYVINPCIGVYPLELRYTYPFTQTVTYIRARLRKKDLAILKKAGYNSIYVAKEGKVLRLRVN